ncbi:MAG: DUF1254 domain-containing protein [Polyangiaceae bacterium]|nr:DUF1254 domain-containing protein [Polyangiaceae bacterium]
MAEALYGGHRRAIRGDDVSLLFNYLLLHQWGLPAQGASEGRPTDTHNQFWHQKALTTASYRDGGSPNNDTMYSVAWAYVGEEPMVLITPDMDVEDRYWTIQIASYSSDNFAYVGTRTTGQKGGAYVITPPGWKGTLPDGVTHLAEAPTKWIFLLGRTLVKGDVDVKNVHKIPEKYRLVALSDFGKDNPPRAAAPQVANLSPKLTELFRAKGGMGNVLKQVTKESPVEFLRLATESMKQGGIPEKEREIFKAS